MSNEVFKAQFTTSQEDADRRKDERSSYFGDNVKVITPAIVETSTPVTRTLQEPPSSVAYDRPYDQMNDSQRARYNEDLRDNEAAVYRLKETQKKDLSNRGFRYAFEQDVDQ